MKYIINKQLILEDYMQDMIDGIDSVTAIARNGQDANEYVQDESILDKFKKPDPNIDTDVLQSKYPLFEDPNHTSLKMIRSIADQHNLPYDQSVQNAHTFMKNVGHIENDGNVHGGNHVKGSTIEGLYQTSEGQAQTARNRFNRDFDIGSVNAPYLDKDLKIPVADMDKQQQTALTIAGLSGHGNSSNSLQHFSKMLGGNESAARDMYFKDHHTRPDQNTLVRANGIFSKMKLNG